MEQNSELMQLLYIYFWNKSKEFVVEIFYVQDVQIIMPLNLICGMNAAQFCAF